jgi:uncharacterized membrane protein
MSTQYYEAMTSEQTPNNINDERWSIEKLNKSTHFIKQRNLVKWFLLSVVPFAALAIAALCNKNIETWVPSFAMMQCGSYASL